jgi:hypothetical protein
MYLQGGGNTTQCKDCFQMLFSILELLDNIGVFVRSNGLTPFLLLGGHQSRFGLPSLKEIHDDQYKWTYFVGDP